MELQKQIEKAKNPAIKAVGQILQKLAKANSKIAELLEQDLKNKSMSIEKCYKALEQYAKAHQVNGCFACPVFDLSAENEIINVILDFYKIPREWLEQPKTQAFKHKKENINLMDLI